MRLKYCKLPHGNFGDDLNVALWPALFPDLEARHPETWLYGVGTILGGTQPDGPKVVLGSGCGYRGTPRLGSEWQVYWVRGPGTAARCHLDPALGLGDAAVLWPPLQRERAPVTGRIGLVPHHKSYDSFDWDALARDAGLYPIDPRQSPQAVADAIASCERVLTESLHGAIFADTLGVPWRALVLARRFNDFKWQDWLDTLGLKLRTAEVHVELKRDVPAAKAVGNFLARWVGGPDERNHLRPIRPANASDIERVRQDLLNIAAETGSFVLSDPAVRAAQQARMREACARFAREHGLAFTQAD
ncbi:polysaccharide pyruvyl transferase family protein [Lysobacter solisilvae (ex Woo and Kim 2020)]|uniref:Polysaccharide pyruvyl transferase family protein n=1 Tax=Agrilutibacter terrestris TaxID=2865112 RepID=A0A7H0G0C6_9GAMM|nr:polysaccharide pyruvyl transferase family protein [Lysobacter terrestris]QNP41742.1 polysaccharide pyruvyl transferase family protein [Lysobacter terrestris]